MPTQYNIGDTIENRYQIVRLLGQGGFGRTYLVKDINRFGEIFVVKQFIFNSPNAEVVKKAQELFNREAKSLHDLNHEQIPKFIEAFTLNSEDFFLVQEYIEGATYYHLIFEQQQRFTETQVRNFLVNTLEVLVYIHSQGIIHRDISPDNIICRTQDQKPVIIDFGCIKQEITKLTISSAPTVISKPHYTPREVQLGDPQFSSDLYSLAITALVILTGKPPDTLFDINSDDWKWSEITITPALKSILIKMLASQMNARYQTATEALQALQALPPISTTPTIVSGQSQTPSSSGQKRLKMSARWLILLFTAVLLLILFPKLISILFPAKNITSTTFVNEKLTAEQKEINQLINSNQFSLAISKLEQYRRNNPRDAQSIIVLEDAKIGLNKSYTIAIVVPISDNSDVSEEMLRGVAQAHREINAAGGINGIPVKILLVDDSSDKNIVRKNAQQLADNQDILAIIGHFSSDNSLAASDIYQKEKILMISSTSTSTNLTNKGEYIKRTVVNDAIAGGTLAKYVSEKLHKQKAAIFYNSKSNYSKSLKQSFTNEYIIAKGEIVYESDLSESNFNAGQRVKEAIIRKAEVIMLASNSSILDKALQVMQANKRKLPLVGGDSLYVNVPILSTGCSDAQGMILAVSWNIKNHLQDSYVKTANDLFKAEVSWRSPMTYNALSAIISGLKKTANPTRQSLQETLSKSDFFAPGADEEVKFDTQGDRIKPVELVTVNGNKCTFEPIK